MMNFEKRIPCRLINMKSRDMFFWPKMQLKEQLWLIRLKVKI